jgi:hypothetical protein
MAREGPHSTLIPVGKKKRAPWSTKVYLWVRELGHMLLFRRYGPNAGAVNIQIQIALTFLKIAMRSLLRRNPS